MSDATRNHGTLHVNERQMKREEIEGENTIKTD